jgi:hypothetical protein
MTNSIIDVLNQKANITQITMFSNINRFHPALFAIGFNSNFNVGDTYHVVNKSKVRPVKAMAKLIKYCQGDKAKIVKIK